MIPLVPNIIATVLYPGMSVTDIQYHLVRPLARAGKIRNGQRRGWRTNLLLSRSVRMRTTNPGLGAHSRGQTQCWHIVTGCPASAASGRGRGCRPTPCPLRGLYTPLEGRNKRKGAQNRRIWAVYGNSLWSIQVQPGSLTRRWGPCLGTSVMDSAAYLPIVSDL